MHLRPGIKTTMESTETIHVPTTATLIANKSAVERGDKKKYNTESISLFTHRTRNSTDILKYMKHEHEKSVVDVREKSL